MKIYEIVMTVLGAFAAAIFFGTLIYLMLFANLSSVDQQKLNSLITIMG